MKENNLNIQVYSSCNCSCNFCKFTDNCKNTIDPKFVLDYIKEHENITYILLTGGEPTFALDVCSEIIENLNLDEKQVVLQTNGWWGDNDEIKNQIKATPPSCVHLSADYEKQKIIDIETVKNAYKFLTENNIKTYIVNHHEADNKEEFEYYQSIFPDIKYGTIIKEDNEYTDCGVALLATNKVSRLDIKGWN